QSANGGPYRDDQMDFVSTLDLFRFSTESVQQGAGVIDFTADTRAKYFSINGGATSIADFATGVTYGDGRQASHWKDNLGLGIMDPTAAPGELLAISATDVQALDVIGYNLAAPEPGTFLLLAAGLAVIARRRLTS
ncbi:MAG TPA: NF038122 family metalloprotease, partial [Bryobacteraceae bacterium]|nr:NF038122 family metalloprotease [Bryobacteraceae bacterium]